MSKKQGRKGKSRRSILKKSQKRVIRVLAEGEVTEPTYLRELCGKAARLDFGKTGSEPADLVRRAKKELEFNRQRHKDDRFDEIWCVFDRDSHPNFRQTVREARDAGIQIAFSNPCFEIWLVWHVEVWSAHVEREEIQRRSKELGITRGKRLLRDAISKLRTGFVQAKSQAEKLDKARELDGSEYGANPHSDVWRLVEVLQAEG